MHQGGACQEGDPDVSVVDRCGGRAPIVNVAAFCRSRTSPSDVYKYGTASGGVGRARGTLAGRKFAREYVEVENLIVEIDKELAGEGHDAGAATIHYHLARRLTGSDLGCRRRRRCGGSWIVAGSSQDAAKRPKVSWRRFEAAHRTSCGRANSDWLITGGVVQILSFLDDHSRLACTRGLATVHTEAVVTLREAPRWGTPTGQLTITVSSPETRGIEVGFEIHLRQLGVRAITTRPFHPRPAARSNGSTDDEEMVRWRDTIGIDDLNTPRGRRDTWTTGTPGAPSPQRQVVLAVAICSDHQRVSPTTDSPALRRTQPRATRHRT